jgi:mono/diheme cytochrome c family protein
MNTGRLDVVDSSPVVASVSPFGLQPVFGATTTAARAPVPLSGGTLLMLDDGVTAVATDPDRDQVYLVDLSTSALRATIALQRGDEPGRSVEDGAGRVHVVLRGGGALVTLDAHAGVIVERRAVCAAPRGIAYEPANDVVDIACAGGELVTLPAAGGAATRTLQLELDLRDVVVVGEGLWVSTFRTAHVIQIEAGGIIGATQTLPGSDPNAEQSSVVPNLAWRMAALPDGQIGISHQEAATFTLTTTTESPYYGGGCDGVSASAMSFLDPATMRVTASGLFDGVTLPVDFAIAPRAGTLAVLSAGSSHTPGLPTLSVEPLDTFVFPPGSTTPATDAPGSESCYSNPSSDVPVPSGSALLPTTGEVVALAYDSNEQLWVQTREPATLQLVNGNVTVVLSADSRADTGWAVFHSDTGAGITCASCHAEGGDDGHTWQFDTIGARRTQSLRGKISGTAPFHWDGSLVDFPALVSETYNTRMAGPPLAPDQQQAMLTWIDAIPTIPHSPPADASAVTRGSALFASQGCIACHSGPELTNNQTVDVGTGGSFQVARLLGVGWRAPFLHDGRAATLTDRFGSGGGGDAHGVTSTLSASQIADLVAYLNSI